MDRDYESHPLLTKHVLLQKENDVLYTGDGSVDLYGKPVLKSKTGTWKACPFILGNECCERLAYYGIVKNLVSYLTVKLHLSNVSAAKHVATWSGTCYLTPLIGAFLADSCWGRYWTLVIFSTIYFIGMCTLTLSASVPALKPTECVDLICPPPAPSQYIILFLGLYLIAFGTGGIKPCVSFFGADQFDDTDPEEKVKKGSFFNWYYFCVNIGSLISSSLIVWIQDNVGWGLGFGIPAIFMGIAIITFICGTSSYRFQKPGGSPLIRMCQVLVASWHKHKLKIPDDYSLLYETSDKNSMIEGSRKLEHTEELKCLDKAAILSDNEKKGVSASDPWRLCSVTQVEELKIMIRMLPICATSIVFAAVYSQLSTVFVEQGIVMNRTIGSFTIPSASLSTFNVISIIIWVPIYDQILVPLARKFTDKKTGISPLQRMGIGLFFSILAMISAALVEIKRLQLANELGLIDENVAVPLTVMWQVPQYFLVGAAEVFIIIGQLEFFYDEAPDAMRSLCAALCLLTTSLGSYLNSLILTIVTAITTAGGKSGWIPDNLNKGRLDCFFWLIAGLSFVNLVVYILCAIRYKPKRAS